MCAELGGGHFLKELCPYVNSHGYLKYTQDVCGLHLKQGS